MNGLKKWWKALSVFEKISVVIIPILVVTIIVTAIVIADKNEKLSQLKRKNEQISSSYIEILQSDKDFFDLDSIF